MNNPVSTYRIQFNKDFKFSHLLSLVSYFKSLGVKTIYASPVFKAVPGSMHGYDIVNPHQINPEIGTEGELRTLIHTLHAAGIGWLQDIVPNHMGFHVDNVWLMDVLEKGSMSVYSDFFDITWAGGFYRSRLMVPFLDASLEDTVTAGALSIVHHRGILMFRYADDYYPVNARAYQMLIENDVSTSDALRIFAEQVESLHRITEPTQYALRMRELELEFSAMMNATETREIILAALAEINRTPERMLMLCDEQSYRLCDWRETSHRINYRRFFTINSLICLNMQAQKVFDLYHRFIKTMVDERLFDGLRIDHIDGLYDPAGYLARLRNLCGRNTYIIAEKILEPGEELDITWPIQGTTGYDFLSAVNNLFTFRRSEPRLSSFYASLLKHKKNADEKRIEKKAAILNEHMQGELDNLYHLFIRSGLGASGMPDETFRDAIGVFLVLCPVYRLYGNALPLEPKEANQISDVLFECRRRRSDLTDQFDQMERVLLEAPRQGDEEFNRKVLIFYQRCMQFSGPLMAKGVEDTLMYTFNRFVAHNEVGDSPGVFGISAMEFHKQMQERSRHWPLTLNATATHDTKRGEDSRMRLNILSDLASEWIGLVKGWMDTSAEIKTGIFPDANDEYFIYQAIAGSYPFEPEPLYAERLHTYFTKAFREAKRFTDWSDPDETFESSIRQFVERLLNPHSKFLQTFLPFHQKISDFGIINSLSQVVLKFTCPGVPDCYQGTTAWDLSLVDPDNRKAVDYSSVQQQLLDFGPELTDNKLLKTLWALRADGRIKHWLTSKLLELRANYPDLLSGGQYLPVEIKGRHRDHALSFARRKGTQWIVVVVPLNSSILSEENSGGIDWSDTAVKLPEEFPLEWKDILGACSGKHQGEILLRDVLTDLPFALLFLEQPVSKRKAGILLSLTSLPSQYGIGELGTEARMFVDMLSSSGQSYWQLLPLNPVSASASFSPYSSYSSRAGNPLLISGTELVTMSLLTEADLQEYLLPATETVNYKRVQSLKYSMLDKAWMNFNKGMHNDLRNRFDEFIRNEREWLDDFVLFKLLMDEYGERWEEWPQEFKLHDALALDRFMVDRQEDIRKTQFIQFLFFEQWMQLKHYCNDMGVKLIGDLPFYVSYHSADVWSHPEFFALDQNQKIEGVAGVPPDFFSNDGQLWGMPVYRWERLGSDGFAWWIERIKKNLELFDVIRLDHFRAFANYWEVRGDAATARTGEWKDGPGERFFLAVQQQLGALPFIAEDLGEIHPDVFALREKLNLPGMKVLQFAFGKDIDVSPYAPHQFDKNFVVYTGTHDNNTTRGWFRKDITYEERQRISDYFGYRINEKNISESLIRLAYSSVAETVIIPMQDILNLTERSRMNLPSTSRKNWEWKLKSLSADKIKSSLLRLTHLYGR